MRLLLTGASSFTGFWFAKALAEAGHSVVAPLRGARDSYDGQRAERVRRLEAFVELEDDCAFGAPKFMGLLSSKYDVLCHHAAQVGNYRSPDFDVEGAVGLNTLGLAAMLGTGNIHSVVLTGSLFEPNEGAGSLPLVAFSPYGQSKALTAQLMEQHCRNAGVSYGKFVIPNPFGPLEEPRFCAYLVHTWIAGETAIVNTPLYVRDNIHVSLLAKAYTRYVVDLAAGQAPKKLNPSDYVESQGEFAARFAREMRARSSLACELSIANQTDFSEPAARFNADSARNYVDEWSEEGAWNGIAEAYSIGEVNSARHGLSPLPAIR